MKDKRTNEKQKPDNKPSNRPNKEPIIGEGIRLELQDIAKRLDVRSDVQWIKEQVFRLENIAGKPRAVKCLNCNGRGYVKENNKPRDKGSVFDWIFPKCELCNSRWCSGSNESFKRRCRK